MGVVSAVGIVLVASGCYRRTIETKGIGTDRIETQEPYAEDWPFETIQRELEEANRPSPR